MKTDTRKTVAALAWAALAAGLLAGCASSSPSATAGDSTIPRSSGVTVFGTIDAGVSRYEKK